MNIREAFEKNLKLISRTEINAECMNGQFQKTKTRDCIVIGNVDLPSGRIRVGGAFAYMKHGELTPELDRTVKPGSYPVEAAVINTAFDIVRITAARIRLTGERAVRYYTRNRRIGNRGR